jgi:hypothetical protein
MSPFVDFPHTEILDKLNEIEGRASSKDRWGGSDTIGGSPRQSGSEIKPRDLEQIVNELIDRTDRPN